MVAPNARDFLKKENELLDELANRAATFANKATGLEADIYNAWQQDFRRRRESNEEPIGANDSDFKQGLTEESKSLKACAIPLRETALSLTIGERILTRTSLSPKKCFKGVCDARVALRPRGEPKSMTHRYH